MMRTFFTQSRSGQAIAQETASTVPVYILAGFALNQATNQSWSTITRLPEKE